MDMMKKRSQIMRLVLVVFLGQALCGPSLAAETPPSGKSGIALVRAVMCESITGYEPRNTAVVFSIDVGRISCFTSFDRISAVEVVRRQLGVMDATCADILGTRGIPAIVLNLHVENNVRRALAGETIGSWPSTVGRYRIR